MLLTRALALSVMTKIARKLVFLFLFFLLFLYVDISFFPPTNVLLLVVVPRVLLVLVVLCHMIVYVSLFWDLPEGAIADIFSVSIFFLYQIPTRQECRHNTTCQNMAESKHKRFHAYYYSVLPTKGRTRVFARAMQYIIYPRDPRFYA